MHIYNLKNLESIWDEFYNMFDTKVKSNIIEKENCYKIECEVPGYSKEELSISIEKSRLLIVGNKKEKSEDLKYYLKERDNKNFRKVYDIGDNINKDKIIANLKNGILYIKLEKKAVEKPIIIEIDK